MQLQFIFHVNASALPELKVTAHIIKDGRVQLEDEIEVGVFDLSWMPADTSLPVFQSQLAEMLQAAANLGCATAMEGKRQMEEDFLDQFLDDYEDLDLDLDLEEESAE